jgi:hypothetical protein
VHGVEGEVGAALDAVEPTAMCGVRRAASKGGKPGAPRVPSAHAEETQGVPQVLERLTVAVQNLQEWGPKVGNQGTRLKHKIKLS